MGFGLMKLSVDAHQMVTKRLARLDEAFGRSTPDGNQAAGLAGFFEVADVLAELLGQVHLVLALLYVRPVDFLDVFVIEDGLHGSDGAEAAFDFVEQVALEDSGVAGGGVHVVFENIPAGEDQIVEAGKRDEVFNFGRAAVGALAETDGSHLGEGADGVGDSLAYGFDACHERGGNGAHAGDHHAELALGRFDRVSGAAVIAAGQLHFDQGLLQFVHSSCRGLLQLRHSVAASL